MVAAISFWLLAANDEELVLIDDVYSYTLQEASPVASVLASRLSLLLLASTSILPAQSL